jgi:hypothetical protein
MLLERGHKGYEEVFRQFSKAWKKESSREVGSEERRRPHSIPNLSTCKVMVPLVVHLVRVTRSIF